MADLLRFFAFYVNNLNAITCGRDNLKSFSCILLKFFMHVTNKHFSDKFNNGWKKLQMADLMQFLHFTSIIWLCGRDNLKSFSCILPKLTMLCMLLVTSSRKSSIMFFMYFSEICYACYKWPVLGEVKYNGWKKNQNGWFIAIFRILHQ